MASEKEQFLIPMPDHGQKRVVVIGGGFGGLRLVRALKGQPVQVVLVDKHNYHHFQPLLYQVATAGLEPKGHPMLAPVAMQQGTHLGKNFRRLLRNEPLEPFTYRDKGTMVTIGRMRTVADLPFAHFSGFPAWLSWMAVHLFYLVGFRNKLFVLVDWTWNYFTYERGARLIIKLKPARETAARPAIVPPPDPTQARADTSFRGHPGPGGGRRNRRCPSPQPINLTFMLHTPPVEAPVSTNLKAVLLLASSLTVMSGATIAAALPLIETHFASQPNAGLYARLLLTVPALLIAVGSPFAGVFVDRFGRKKLLLASLVLYGLAGTSGAFADSLLVLLAGRVLLGIAVAGIMTTSSALVADYFGGKERQQFLGTQAAAMSLGGVLFISLGGWLATLGWREPFYVYLAALALVPFAYSLVREPVLAKAAAPASGVKLAGALTGTVLRLYLVIFTGMVMFYLVPVQIPFLLRNLDASPALTGVAIAAATLAGAVASFHFTRIRSRWSTAPIYGVAFLCTGTGFLGIAFAGDYWLVVVSLFVCGLGNGLLMPNTSLAVMAATPEAVRGRVLGGLSTAIFLGQFISPLVAAPVATGVGLAGVFGYAGAVMVLLALAFVLLGNRLLPESPSPG